MAIQMQHSHRLFLQSFMSKGILNSQEVRTLYNSATTRFGDDSSLSKLAQFVSVINANIKPFHLEIKKAISEENGSHWYGLVNTAESEITRMSPAYSENELEFFKLIVEKIVRGDVGKICSIDALNLTDKLEKKLSKDEAQKVIKRLQQDRWLSDSVQGEVSLSTRSLLELDQYIQQQFPDYAVNCEMCKKLCLKGQSCKECDIKLHLHCANRYFLNQAAPKCPSNRCNTPWPHPIPQSVSRKDGGSPTKSQSTPEERSSGRKRRGESS